MRLILREGDRKDQRRLITQLVKMQYRRTDTDFVRGTFRVRGDTIDVFPAEHAESAVRIELFDDEVEAVHLFDPLTGRIRAEGAPASSCTPQATTSRPARRSYVP